MTWQELIEKIPLEKLCTEAKVYDGVENEDYLICNSGWDNPEINDNGFYIVF